VAIGVFIVLLALMFSTQFIRFLGLASRGLVPPDAVLTLMGFAALGYIAPLLILSMFLSVLWAITRAYRDSEMVIWQTSGVSLISYFKPVLIFALPLVLIVGLLSLYLTPWAIGKSEEYRHQLENRDDVSAVTPGVFRESRNGERVFFVEKVTTDLSQVANIFVSSVEPERMDVVVASRGFASTEDDGDRYLVLLNGRRYEGTPGQADYQIAEFSRYAIRIEQSGAKAFFPSQKSLSTWQLLENPTPINRAELTWRVGLPVAALLLAFLAVPMSVVNPRSGRFSNVIAGFFLAFLYSNMISIGQAWVAQDKIPTWIGMWIVHIAMLVLTSLLLAQRIGYLRMLQLRR
jgi:lipopolysaccharide export system permease protein